MSPIAQQTTLVSRASVAENSSASAQDRASRLPPAPTWYVARTNPRCEERARAGLAAAGFHVYLPRGTKLVRRRYTKTRRTVRFPLLTGYLFVGLGDGTPGFYDLRQVDGVRGVLGAAGRPLPVAAFVVEAFRELETAGTFAEARRPRPFSPGDRVIVRAGPLAGLVVHFEDYAGTKAGRVVARLFGQERAVSIPLAQLDATPEPHRAGAAAGASPPRGESPP